MAKQSSRPTCPYIPPDLLDYLDKLYPDRCPSITATNREIWIEVGKRAVIQHLRLEQGRQQATPKTIG